MWSRESARKKELPRDWARLRTQILKRDHNRCVFCGMEASHVDHIRRGSDHSPCNLRSLCEHCHMMRTGHDGGMTRRKKVCTRRQPERHPAYR